MTKMFCDNCLAEIVEDEMHVNPRFRNGPLLVEINIIESAEVEDVCDKCLIKAVIEGAKQKNGDLD